MFLLMLMLKVMPYYTSPGNINPSTNSKPSTNTNTSPDPKLQGLTLNPNPNMFLLVLMLKVMPYYTSPRKH